MFTDNVNACLEICPTPGRKDAMHPGTRSDMVAFCKSVQSGNQPEMDAIEAARVVSLSISIEESIRQGRVEKVPRIDRIN